MVESDVFVSVGDRFDTTDRTHLHFYRNIVVLEDHGAVLLVKNKAERFHVTRAFLVQHIRSGVLVKHQQEEKSSS